VTPGSKSAVAAGMAGLGLLIPASMGLFVSNVPTILCPFPALTVIPAFFLSDRYFWRAAVLVPVLFFFVWHPGLFRGETKIPKRSYGLLLVAILLGIADFVTSWNWGLHYQGIRYLRVVCAVNVAWAAFLVFAFARSWKAPSTFRSNLFLHWMLFAWLAWFAFPYMGELP
jgi:hypothetical protein